MSKVNDIPVEKYSASTGVTSENNSNEQKNKKNILINKRKY